MKANVMSLSYVCRAMENVLIHHAQYSYSIRDVGKVLDWFLQKKLSIFVQESRLYAPARRVSVKVSARLVINSDIAGHFKFVLEKKNRAKFAPMR